MLAIPFLLFHRPIGIVDIAQVGHAMIWLAVFLTILSMAYYLRLAWPTMIANEKARQGNQ